LKCPYCLNVIDFIRAMILNSCKTVLRHTAQKWCNSFYDRTLLTAADEWASYYPYLNPLDYCIWDILQDLVYEGRRLPFANLRISKRQSKINGRRSPLRQFENPLHNGKRLNVVIKQNGGGFNTFRLIAVTGYRSHPVRRVELIGYFVCFGHLILFCVFYC